MKVAKLIHNPKAGDEEHSGKELISLIESKGYRCIYSSIKDEDWRKIDDEVDFLIAAGGDGTVRKIVKEILKRKVLERTWPIGLLPLGTANNIAKALGIVGTTKEIVDCWKSQKRKRFDVGCVGAGEDLEFFLEGFGCGIFPYLMLEMKNQHLESIEDLDLKMNSTLGLLHQIVLAYEPHQLELTIDGADHSGKYILVEIMNTRSIGPNLVLAPDADPGDGEFDLVLIAEKNKDRFATYLENRVEGNAEEYRYDTLRGKEIRVFWQGTHIHVDGKTVKRKAPVEMRIGLRQGVIEFLVP